MKICIIAGKGDRSGVPKYVSRLYETMKVRHDVMVVADSDTGGFEEIDRHRLKLLPGLASGRPALQKLKAFLMLRRYLDGADIVWAHSSFSVLFARLLSTVTAYELIVTYHGVPFGAGRKKITGVVAYLVEIFISKLVKHSVVVISAQDRRSVNAIKPRGEISYIPNFVDAPMEFATPITQQQRPRILMTTRDCYQKNIDHAVSIMNELPRYCLDVYGEVSDERKELLTENNVARNIRFMGVVPYQQIAFVEYDFYLMTSHYEGFSLGLLEALSQGLYIATTKVGGAEEVTEDNPYSVLLNCDAVADAVAINDLLQRHGPNLGKKQQISLLAEKFQYSEWQRRCLALVENVR